MTLTIEAAIAWIKSNPSRFVLGAGCIVMVLAVLFPPFQGVIYVHQGNVIYEHSGFHFLFTSLLSRVTVNIGLLGLELMVIGFVTATAYVIFRNK
jgi:hypothetical protein